MRFGSRLALFLGLALVATVPGMLVKAVAQEPVSRVEVTAETGEPLPARVVVTRQGTPTPDLYVFFTDREGRCRLEGVPDGPATLEVNHGPEWAIQTLTVTLDGQSERALPVRLKRLYDLPAHGYYQGDSHMHSTFSDGKQTPEEVAYHCRCEGLQWAFLTDHNGVQGHAAFQSQAAPGFLPLGGDEVTTAKGHILALGVTTRISPDVSHGADDCRRIFREIHDQGGVAILAHPTAPFMGYRSWEVEGYDGLEILNGSLPPYGGMFDALQARTRWHRLLSEGKRLPALGDSDNHDNTMGLVRDVLRDPQGAVKREPLLQVVWNMPDRDRLLIPWALKGVYPGIYRTCLKLPELTQAAVLAAIKQGRGVVTNGPLLVATVNGTDPGSEIKGPSAQIRYEAVGNRGLDRLVVLADGKQVQSVDLSGQETKSGELSVDLGTAKWLALELYGKWPDFATTNAWYVAPGQ